MEKRFSVPSNRSVSGASISLSNEGKIDYRSEHKHVCTYQLPIE